MTEKKNIPSKATPTFRAQHNFCVKGTNAVVPYSLCQAILRLSPRLEKAISTGNSAQMWFHQLPNALQSNGKSSVSKPAT